ncbi:hypothetical protein ACFL17_04495 [Pseudomonadota bacterium]
MKKLILVCSLILLSACNSGGTSSNTDALIVAGPWGGRIRSTVGDIFVSINMTIQQAGVNDLVDPTNNAGTTFTGIYRMGQMQCGLLGGTFSGTITGVQVTMTLTDNSGTTMTFSGNITRVIQGIAQAMNGLLNAKVVVPAPVEGETVTSTCGDFTGTWALNRL